MLRALGCPGRATGGAAAGEKMGEDFSFGRYIEKKAGIKIFRHAALEPLNR